MQVAGRTRVGQGRNGHNPAGTTRRVGIRPAPGDHVSVDRGLYRHHAIYMGDGWLIEFGQGVLGGSVAWIDWDGFAKGRIPRLENRAGEMAAQRAYSQLGRNDFDLMSRNCEHFANWCATGDWSSLQARTAMATLGLASVVLLAAQRRR